MHSFKHFACLCLLCPLCPCAALCNHNCKQIAGEKYPCKGTKHKPQRALIPLLSPTHAASCCCLWLCTCAHALSRKAALALSLDARSFSVDVAALRASFFAFAKHVNFCVYFLIFVRQCALFLFSCCLLLLASLLASVAPVLLCLCCAACSASASASACCFALHFIHSIKTSKHSRRRMGKRGRKSYGNCFSWHLLSQAIGSLQPFVLTAFSCVGLWKLAQNMPQLGIPRQLCSCCGESFFSSFSFSSFSSFVHFGTSVAFCICSLCECVCFTFA